jgi:hypothetical protein
MRGQIEVAFVCVYHKRWDSSGRGGIVYLCPPVCPEPPGRYNALRRQSGGVAGARQAGV